MPKQKLFDEESEEEVEIKTENEYAKKYDKWRGKEEIHKLEQKYGTKVLNSDASVSSDSEDESDESPEVSEEMETQFLKTLALLKKKDPRIYDPEFKFFDEKEKDSIQEAKVKTLTFADSDDDDDDDDDGNIFSIEKKAEIEIKRDDKEAKDDTLQNSQDGQLKDYLTGKVARIDNPVEKDLEPLKALWSDPKLNEGEAFLRDYILNKKYLEEGEVGEAQDKLRDDEELGADEQMVEEQDKFERAYNFRFEEPDHEYLKRFPRTMNFIRPKDERRSKKRVETRSRKEDERTRKMEEIARLKALKLQEIQEKIARIKEVTGNDELAFKDSDIENEFDPAEHDRRMRAIFDDQYYGHADSEKPVFPDLDKELEIENWEEYEPGQEEEREAQDFSVEGPHCEDAEFNMDAEYDANTARANLLEEMRRSLGKKRRNRKNKSKLAKLLAATTGTPSFQPHTDTTYAQYMEDYYKMDCEDVIGGDLPTRFKYREVVPNDYGLTVEEILLADDKELTQWVPLKRLVRHRPESVQKSEVNAYKQKASDARLKRKLLPSLFKNLPEEPELVASTEENSKKKKKKKKKQKYTVEPENAAAVESADEIEPITNENNDETGEADDDISVDKVGKKKKKDGRKNTEVSNIDVKSTTENGDASTEGTVNDSVNDVKNVHKHTETLKNRNSSVEITANVSAQRELSKRQKKNLKRKMKKKGIVVENVKNETPSKNSQMGKKRKISDNEQGSNKKHNDDVTNDAKKHKNDVTNEAKKHKNDVTNEAKKHKNDVTNEKNKHLNKNGVKNKESSDKGQKVIKNKDKFKNKTKQNNDTFKNKIKSVIDKNKSSNDNSSDNPMNNLSDERLKAYGLNPKKYRSFLKYKKF